MSRDKDGCTPFTYVGAPWYLLCSLGILWDYNPLIVKKTTLAVCVVDSWLTLDFEKNCWKTFYLNQHIVIGGTKKQIFLH